MSLRDLGPRTVISKVGDIAEPKEDQATQEGNSRIKKANESLMKDQSQESNRSSISQETYDPTKNEQNEFIEATEKLARVWK